MKIKSFFILFVIFLCGCAETLPPEAPSEITTRIYTQSIAVETTIPPETTTATTTENIQYEGELKAHFLDVGQGDSVFIELPDGLTILIDAGEKNEAPGIINYIKTLGYEKIDILIATHPHADHIGGIAQVVRSFKIGTFYLSDCVHATATYENMLDAISAYNINTKTTHKGDILHKGENLAVITIAPEEGSVSSNINNSSIAVLITFGETSFMFMGDAEFEEEETIDIPECDVLKVAHHGSSTSTSESFLKKARPKIAVISCGKDNQYGHPSIETVARLMKFGATIYRTDTHGTVNIISDGKSVIKK